MSVYYPRSKNEWLESARAVAAKNVGNPDFPCNVLPVNLEHALTDKSVWHQHTVPAQLLEGVVEAKYVTGVAGKVVKGNVVGESVTVATYKVDTYMYGMYWFGTVDGELVYVVTPDDMVVMAEGVIATEYGHAE